MHIKALWVKGDKTYDHHYIIQLLLLGQENPVWMTLRVEQLDINPYHKLHLGVEY
jgi:hypothetical protein